MSTTEDVERKVEPEGDSDRTRDDNSRRVVRGGETDEETREAGSHRSGVGDYLTDLSVSGSTLARFLLGILLFGGLLLTFGGVALVIESRVGTEGVMIVAGLAAIVLSYVLAQVYARRGLI